MEGFLKVSPESLKSAAGEFGGQARQLQGLTSQMLDLIRSLSAAWNGDASRAYLTKFATTVIRYLQELPFSVGRSRHQSSIPLHKTLLSGYDSAQ